MKRRMTITVINNENEVWNKTDATLEHGKWMKDNPPRSILKNSEATIESEKQSGATYGTTGNITFISSLIGGNTLFIEWNKPYGSDPTTVKASITGDNYEVEVTNEIFQKEEASCDVVIHSIK